jgi:thiol-disulfide isomerase/thioredoxin
MEMMRRTVTGVLTAVLAVSTACGQPLKHGPWHGWFFLNDTVRMPFRMDVSDNGLFFLNDQERIRAEQVTSSGDSLFIRMPVFDAGFSLRSTGDTLSGIFVNRMRLSNREIRCSLQYGEIQPLHSGFALPDFSGRWSVRFAGDDPPLERSVGEFRQEGSRLAGSFLTPTGDYRFLEGHVTPDGAFELSAFDGSHVFYFTAVLSGDTLYGQYYSGTHWHDTWTAWRDARAALPDPESLAFLKPDAGRFTFAFPDTNGTVVSLSDSVYRGKVVLVSVMGSWCPNCMDEARVLSRAYRKYRAEGLEIIGLDFERVVQPDTVRTFIRKFCSSLDITYPVLFAGTTDRRLRAQALPQLSDIVAFPTLIYVDRRGVVRKIHTGFNGPATGVHFEKWEEDFDRFLRLLLGEK